MITIKKKHNINDIFFIELLEKYNNVIRYSYNRRIKDKITKLSDLEKNVKQFMNNIDCLDASLIKCAVKKSTELQIDKKLYFGGKSNFFKRKFNKINNLNKLTPLEVRGSSSDPNGNRKACLNGSIFTFKPNRKIKYDIELKLSKNESRLLSIIEEESKQGLNYFNFEINEKYVWISFNEPVLEKHESKKDRYLGIDLNPNWLAISILDSGSKEIFKELIDLRLLNKSKRNKKLFEIIQINKHIINLCKHYQVQYVCIEDLIINSKNHKLGKYFNKLINNDWNRNYLVNNLTKWLNISSIKYKMVNPFYTSFIGQVKNIDDYDSIAASKEVAYRAYLMSKGIKVSDYVNNFLSDLVSTHWKEMIPNINTYKEMYDYFKSSKKSKNKYRFLFNDVEKYQKSYFRLNSFKSLTDLIMV